MDLDAPHEGRFSIQPSDAPTEPAEPAGAEELNGMSELSTDSPDGHLWACSSPWVESIVHQLDFWRINPIVTIGSAKDNQIVLNHRKISSFLTYIYYLLLILTDFITGSYHCVFEWDGKDNYCVRDLSDTGTYVRRSPIVQPAAPDPPVL